MEIGVQAWVESRVVTVQARWAKGERMHVGLKSTLRTPTGGQQKQSTEPHTTASVRVGGGSVVVSTDNSFGSPSMTMTMTLRDRLE